MASVGSKFYVFGGGLSGPEPVPDNTVHVFNAGKLYNRDLLPLLSELLPQGLIHINKLCNATDTNSKLLNYT